MQLDRSPPPHNLTLAGVNMDEEPQDGGNTTASAEVGGEGPGSPMEREGPGDVEGGTPTQGPSPSHELTVTVTIALALPNAEGAQGEAASLRPGAAGRRGRPRGDGAAGVGASEAAGATACFHCELLLIPGRVEKADVVFYGSVARVYIGSDTKVIRAWSEGPRSWVAWKQEARVSPSGKQLLALMSSRLSAGRLRVWEGRERLSQRARHDRPTGLRLRSETDPGRLDRVQKLVRRMLAQLEPARARGAGKEEEEREEEVGEEEEEGKAGRGQHEKGTAVPPPVRGEERGRAGSAWGATGSRQPRRGDARAAERGTPRRGVWGAHAAERGAPRRPLGLTVPLARLVAGERRACGRASHPCAGLLDALCCVSCREPILSQQQSLQLNPMIVRIVSASGLPAAPVPYSVLKERCLPAYCSYRFAPLAPHRSEGRAQGPRLRFDDVNAVPLGLLGRARVAQLLRGPPLRVELHDRDLRRDRSDDRRGDPPGRADDGETTEGEEDGEENEQEGDEKEERDSYGVAFVDLSDLLLGDRLVELSVPIVARRVRRAPADGEDEEHVAVGGVERVAAGGYAESGASLKVRVEVRHALDEWLGEDGGDVEANGGPFGRVVFRFSCRDDDDSDGSDGVVALRLRELEEEILIRNAEALQLDEHPMHVIERALSAYSLSEEQQRDPSLDLLTGFHVYDGEHHLLALEGPRDGAVRRLCEEFAPSSSPGRVAVLFDSSVGFAVRAFAALGARVRALRLRAPLSRTLRDPGLALLPLAGTRGAALAMRAMQRLESLCGASRLRDVVRAEMLPSPGMLESLARHFCVLPGTALHSSSFFSLAAAAASSAGRSSARGPSTLQLRRSASPPALPSGKRKCRPRPRLDNWNPEYVHRQPEEPVDHVKENLERVREASLAVARCRPPGRAVWLLPGDAPYYSSQSLNGRQLALSALREHLNREDPRARHSYALAFASLSLDPVDEAEARRDERRRSRAAWRTARGFAVPGPSDSQRDNEHPLRPDSARREELRKAWTENVLHRGTLRPPLHGRDRWSWELRRSDWEPYGRPPAPPRISASVHAEGPTTAELIRAWEQSVRGPLLAMSPAPPPMGFHRLLPATEERPSGPLASHQLARLAGLLKDPPHKLSLRKPGMLFQAIPALAVVRHPSLEQLSLTSSGGEDEEEDREEASEEEVERETGRGFMPGPHEHRAWTLPGNHLARHSHARGAEPRDPNAFATLLRERALLHRPHVAPLQPEERGGPLFAPAPPHAGTSPRAAALEQPAERHGSVVRARTHRDDAQLYVA
ncbi:uncharacterized protein LOC133342722 isoform X1 [Lethenteron reissneri]|uniref:uncharacterized protein LOC133342722 isoform X1 n=2 Tax=Lethenteron reissneri TaxID=7753 RepID=UPI002AB74378|nr:uncharacterized protein LOC133342722 isoform X1 [Lethenteron reissneri]